MKKKRKYIYDFMFPAQQGLRYAHHAKILSYAGDPVEIFVFRKVFNPPWNFERKFCERPQFLCPYYQESSNSTLACFSREFVECRSSLRWGHPLATVWRSSRHVASGDLPIVLATRVQVVGSNLARCWADVDPIGLSGVCTTERSSCWRLFHYRLHWMLSWLTSSQCDGPSYIWWQFPVFLAFCRTAPSHYRSQCWVS